MAWAVHAMPRTSNTRTMHGTKVAKSKGSVGRFITGIAKKKWHDGRPAARERLAER